jgi:hypothetical protein
MKALETEGIPSDIEKDRPAGTGRSFSSDDFNEIDGELLAALLLLPDG